MEFDSAIGKKKFSGQGMREFSVTDDSGFRPQMVQMDADALRDFQNRMGQFDQEEKNPAEIEREFRTAREAKKAGKERLEDGARRRIDMLLGITRLSREVDVGGNIFSLRTLKSKDMRQALLAASEFDGTVQGPYEIRRQLLGRSLFMVAGVEIEQFIGSDLLNDKFLFIDELDEPLLTRLYDEYVLLSKEAKEKFSIKTESDMKEVLEDLKKS